jgi:tetratricopeptide (TPR) repeat protein
MGMQLPEEKTIQAEGYFLEGMKFIMLDEPEKALMQFKLANEVIPDNPGILFQLGRLYRRLGRNEEALIHLNLAISKDAENYHMINEKAELLFEQNKYEEAAKAWEGVIQLFPDNIDIYLSLAEAYSLSGENALAADALIKARLSMGFVPALMFELQRLLIEIGRFDEAVVQAKSWAVAEPENPDASLNLAELYLSQGLSAEAARVLRSYLEFIGENGDVRLLLTQLDESLGQSPSGNEWLALMNNPQVELRSKLDIILDRREQYLQEDPETLGEALMILSASHPKSAEVLALQADYFISILRWGEAQEVLQKALELDQGDFSLWKKLWDIQITLQLWDEVIATAERAQIYFPSLAEGYYVAAMAYTMKGNHEEASFQLSSAKLYNAGGELLAKPIEALSLYNAYFLGSQESSQSTMTALIDSGQEDPEVAFWAVKLNLNSNSTAEALKIGKALTKNHPDYLPGQQVYAEALQQSGQMDQALELLKEQIKTEGHPLNGIILETIGDYYLQSGNEQEAFTYWNRARENGRNTRPLLQKLGIEN